MKIKRGSAVRVKLLSCDQQTSLWLKQWFMRKNIRLVTPITIKAKPIRMPAKTKSGWLQKNGDGHEGAELYHS